MTDKAKLHWMPLDTDDWLTSRSVKLMTRHERSMYLDLLLLQWKDGSIPSDPEEAAALIHEPAKTFLPSWPRIAANFQPSPGNPGELANPKLHEMREKALNRIAAAAQNGRRGGRPRKQEANPEPNLNETQEKPNPFVPLNPKKPDIDVDVETTETNVSGPPAPAGEPAAVVLEVEDMHPTKQAGPFGEIARVLYRVSKELGWSEPVREDIRRNLGKDSSVRTLIGIYGEQGAADLFLFAHRTWSQKPTWRSVLNQRDGLRERIDEERSGKPPSRAGAKPAAETAEEKAARILAELGVQQGGSHVA